MSQQHHERVRSPDQAIHAAPHAIVNSQRVELGLDRGMIVLMLALVLVIGACGTVMGLNLAKQDQMDRDFRDLNTTNKLLERRYIDMEAYALLNGWKIPSDDAHGPTGNLERMNPRKGK